MPDADDTRLVVLISGRGSNLKAIHSAIQAGWLNARIAAVISDRPGAAGLAWAAATGLDTVTLDRRRFPDRAGFESSLDCALSGFRPDWIVLAGFMRILGQDLVAGHSGRMINIHPSLLPRHRGLNTHRRALEAGDAEHGSSIHFVTPALDSGPVISQARINILPEDSPDRLADRLLPLEHRLYPATLALLCRHRVELNHDLVCIDDQPLDKPLELGRDLDSAGRLPRSDSGR